MTPWEWFTSTTTVDSIIQFLGLGALAVLFATDRILTRGQHMRRIEDLVASFMKRIDDLIAYHERELAEVRESRDGWKSVALKERELRDAAIEGAVASATTAIVEVRHVLESLDEAIGEGH